MAGSGIPDRSMPAAGAPGHDPGPSLTQANFLPFPAFSPEPGAPGAVGGYLGDAGLLLSRVVLSRVLAGAGAGLCSVPAAG